MRLPVPKAPEMSGAGIAWAIATAAVVYMSAWALFLVSPLLALIPNLLLLVACVYLIGGELWNKRSE